MTTLKCDLFNLFWKGLFLFQFTQFITILCKKCNICINTQLLQINTTVKLISLVI